MERIDQRITELLGRSKPNAIYDLKPWLHEKNVFVTGAGGSIGSELCRQIMAYYPKTLILYEQSEFALYQIHQELEGFGDPVRVVPMLGNLSNFGELREVLNAFDIDTIYHAAAYKHVPLCERNPISAVRNNVFGTHILTEAARSCAIDKFITISSDKAVNPANVMGATKRLAEDVTLSCKHTFQVVRFGNVLWSSGSVIPLFTKQIEEWQPLTVTHPDVTRYFMSIEEAVHLTLQTTAMSSRISVFDMGQPVKIVELGRRLANLMGKGDFYVVRYIGLRPGEKLHEELTLGERLHSTAHPMIQEAMEDIATYPTVTDALNQFKYECSNGNVGEVRKLFHEHVVGYAPVCGIMDDVWRQSNEPNTVLLDDCFAPARPDKL